MADDPIIKQVMRLALMALPDNHDLPTITRLAGDASTRRYFRAKFPGGASAVVMAAPDSKSVQSFSAMTTLMRELGADVPGLLLEEGNLLAMEDLGDTMLQTALASMTEEEKEAEYRGILDRLALFQSAARARTDRGMECFSLKFDEDKLHYEVDFADNYFLKERLGRQPHWSSGAIMKLEWEKVIGDLAGEMETLAHRDFHSRNIMALGERRVWIDYQDARMGRMTYDLASLLLDPYVNIGEEMEGRLAGYYYDRLKEAGAAPWDADRFRELYDLSAAQRLYKALGTYGYQTAVRKTDVYIPYIKPAAERLLRILEGPERLARLWKQLAPYLQDA